MNKNLYIGNLTRDPEVKVMSNGKNRAMFTIAVQRDYLNAEGRRDADFITLVAYDKRADFVAKYLSKGRKIYVEAQTRTGSYEKDGRKIYTTEFVVKQIEPLSPLPQHQQQDGNTPPPAEEPPMDGEFMQVDDPELPF